MGEDISTTRTCGLLASRLEMRLKADTDEVMYQSHKIALRPSDKQRCWFAQQCGYAQVAFNYALSDFIDGLHNDEWRSERALRQRFNADKYDKFTCLITGISKKGV